MTCIADIDFLDSAISAQEGQCVGVMPRPKTRPEGRPDTYFTALSQPGVPWEDCEQDGGG